MTKTFQALLRAAVLGIAVLGIAYSMVAADYHHLSTLLMLVPLLAIVEWFPNRIGKMEHLGSFPILYTMAITAGYQTTTVCSVGLLAASCALHRKSLRIITTTCSIRCIALFTAGFATHAIQSSLPIQPSAFFMYYFLNLSLSVCFFTLVTHMLYLAAACTHKLNKADWTSMVKACLLDIGMALAYDGFMIWLSDNPKNTASGPLGTLFFFLPLPAMMIVLHLIGNLTRAKRRLETLFTVSQSMNQQWDLPIVFRHVMKEAKRLVQSPYVCLHVLQEDGSWRIEGDGFEAGGQTTCAPIISLSGEPLVIHDLERDPRSPPYAVHYELRSTMWVPIRVTGHDVGVIALGKTEPFGFQKDDVKMMSIFSTHASVAIRNAMLIQEREQRLILEERNRLAREIHDGLAQNLAGTLYQIELMRRKQGDPPDSALNDLQSALLATVATVRESIYALRPHSPTHLGLVPAIRAHLEEIQTQYGLVSQLEAPPDEPQWSTDVMEVVFAIVNEAIQNVVKHSTASKVFVKIGEMDHAIQVTIADNGCGFEFRAAVLFASHRHSFGIENMYQLAESIDASLDILTSPAEGTVVSLEIPLTKEAANDDQRALV
jgi:signal transduction histidine kinase